MAEYHLQKWNARDKSLRCPKCGKAHGCYKVYVDEAGNEVDPAGADIADVMLRRMRERTADPLTLMKQANPLLEKLIDKMKLECERIDRMTK